MQTASTLAGVDEAGRGPLAGPVVAVACILPDSYLIERARENERVNDSKLLSSAMREKLFLFLTQLPDIVWSMGLADPEEVDLLNIHQATLLAMRRAIEGLSRKPDLALIDGLYVPTGLAMPARALVKGDALSPPISAASILAKVIRDKMMLQAHETYPQYGFKQHKGYGTKAHIEALVQYGPCPIHRKTFEPIRSYCPQNGQL